MSTMTSLKTLGKGELIRRMVLLNSANQIAKVELQKWLDGLVSACAYLKQLDPEHPFLSQMTDSTRAMIDEKLVLVNETAPRASEHESCKKAYYAGKVDGVTEYAWWKDGVQKVGTAGTPLKAVLAKIEEESK